jgi:hypothetical protein
MMCFLNVKLNYLTQSVFEYFSFSFLLYNEPIFIFINSTILLKKWFTSHIRIKINKYWQLKYYSLSYLYITIQMKWGFIVVLATLFWCLRFYDYFQFIHILEITIRLNIIYKYINYHLIIIFDVISRSLKYC